MSRRPILRRMGSAPDLSPGTPEAGRTLFQLASSVAKRRQSSAQRSPATSLSIRVQRLDELVQMLLAQQVLHRIPFTGQLPSPLAFCPMSMRPSSHFSSLPWHV